MAVSPVKAGKAQPQPAPSWWVSASPDQFTAAARAELASRPAPYQPNYRAKEQDAE